MPARPRAEWTQVCVVRPVAIRAPVALQLARVGIEHRDALVAIAIGDINLVGFRINRNLGYAAEIFAAVAVRIRARRTEFGQELAIARELQDVRVGSAVATYPDVVLVIDGDAMV